MNHPLLELTKRIQAIAQAGITYTPNHYDLDRFLELREISVKLMHLVSGEELPVIKDLFARGEGYQTPMVDVRGVIFKEDKILLVKELEDEKWALPGGWADIGYTPSEVVVKEIKEEAGLDTKVSRLLAVIDKKNFNHPPQPFYIYKIIFLCEVIGGVESPGNETLDVAYFGKDEIPSLSLDRVVPEQIELMFQFLKKPDKSVYID